MDETSHNLSWLVFALSLRTLFVIFADIVPDIIGDRIYNECEVSYIAAGDPEKKEVKRHRINLYDRVPRGEPEEGQIRTWTAFFDSSPFKERVMASKKTKGQADDGRVY